MKFYNTISGKIEEFKSLKNKEVRMYTCGPTVYDFAHIGNFRAYIFEDIVRRSFKFLGYKVIQVMNITDVDDKTIRKSNELGISLREYTEKYTEEFFKDIDTLNIERAEYYPRATEHISQMVNIIKKLLEKGYAYIKDDAIYYNISKFKDYGKLAKIDINELKKGSRVNVDEYDKDNVQDFALWKFKREGEPFWETEIGSGRPGWHIECSAMSMEYLGETFDIHMGGVDNIFPHHENEIAQSEASTGKKFVNYWIHVHHLIVNGQKMSKSKGNFFTLRDIIGKGYRASAIRFLLLGTHYRKTLNFTFQALKQAEQNIDRILNFMYELETTVFKDSENSELDKIIEEYNNRFAVALEDDFNIRQALNTLFEFIKKINIMIRNREIGGKDRDKIITAMRNFDKVVGVLPRKFEKELLSGEKELIEERNRLRKDKKYEEADKIRELLKEKGIIIEDTPWGVRWKKLH
jgi:cysteinyl-tRNA synthetase